MVNDSSASSSPRARRIELLIARGSDRIRESEFEEAREYFDEAIQLDPGSAAAYRGRATAWQYLRELGNALSDYNEAIRLDPEDPAGFFNRGTARHAKSDWEGAIADYTEAIRLNVKGLDVYRYRAGAHQKLEQFDAAIQDLDVILKAEPENSRAYFYRATVLLKVGAPDKALADLDRALQFDSRMTSALESRRALLEERGDRARAEEDASLLEEIRKTRVATRGPQKRSQINPLLREHFAPVTLSDLTLTERTFPFRVRADLQRAAQSLFGEGTRIHHYCGISQQYSHEGLNFTALIVPNENYPPISVPPEYEEVDVGDDVPVRCPKNALWLLQKGTDKFAVLLCPAGQFGRVTGLKIQVGAANTPEGTRLTQEFFKHLEDAVLRSQSYRGKVLSLDERDAYSGQSSGILVHRIKDIRRDQVILPKRTLDLLDRNVLSFSKHRGQLGQFGLSKKKGILLYGPPGNGKTHTIQYLAKALEGHTTFLITAGQMGLLSEYMTLARLLQPSLVVVEDVDLIARDRDSMNNACAESLLNVLLNEMDGLQQDCEVFFIMTTNRPESLEAALASRPGRIDQAIEYPMPDEECRERLVRLYSQGMTVAPELVRFAVTKTKGVSASFIRELMRRSAQFHLERGATSGALTGGDVEGAVNELIAGKFNRRLLGAEAEGSAGA
jgi:tetratricopeptide (TPR) repeat protein